MGNINIKQAVKNVYCDESIIDYIDENGNDNSNGNSNYNNNDISE
jgi:hypothetical protein